MNNKTFFSDAMMAGAIVGVVMALSRIFERYELFFSTSELLSVVTPYAIEWVLMVGIFVWLLFFFTRRRAKAADAEVGFSYGQALSFVLVVSMLAGIIVGLADTIFINAMGYDVYVDGMVTRIAEMRNLYIEAGLTQADVKSFDEMAAAARMTEQPSIFMNIFVDLYNYILFGGLPGLIIAAIVRRQPEYRVNND
ncbi:MAG: DUF4199 domain-containing protein [Alistipes sp.]|nr:DUF4199 domain-containing protein [Alistipes sp.]